MTLHEALVNRGAQASILAFLDLKKAYDKVNHGAIIAKLNKIGVGRRFLRATTAMFQELECVVRTRYGQSPTYKYKCGLR